MRNRDMRVQIWPDRGGFGPAPPNFYLSPLNYGSYGHAGKGVGSGGAYPVKSECGYAPGCTSRPCRPWA